MLESNKVSKLDEKISNILVFVIGKPSKRDYPMYAQLTISVQYGI